MGIEWIKSEAARQVIGYLTDPRPAWLWTSDGETLLWSNPAARLFGAKYKRRDLKLAAPAIPIKGQISRLMRLGSIGRTSLSRMQFNVGGRAVSTTCTYIPLRLTGDEKAMLIVAVDPIEKSLMAGHGLSSDAVTGLFGNDIGFLVVDRKQRAIAGTPDLLHQHGSEAVNIADYQNEDVLRFPAGPGSSTTLIFMPPVSNETDGALAPEKPAPAPNQGTTGEREKNLTSLLDKLVEDETLFAPLGPQDDNFFSQTQPDASLADENGNSEMNAEDEEVLWQVIGESIEVDAEPELESGQKDTNDPVVAGNASRYNFAELSRILSDRVGGEKAVTEPADSISGEATDHAGALVNLSEENLVLNRLPMGLLIFRDQQILFANRALTELTGYADTSSLRLAGLGSIFPSAAEATDPVGPITHLAHRDGINVPVTARLQSITWQGNPALMLSAQKQDPPSGAEFVVRNFAETIASAQGKGFFKTNRAGVLESVSGRAGELFGQAPDALKGRVLSILVAPNEIPSLRLFLEKPARFAETSRPSIVLKGCDPTFELLLFAEGQAGLATGYFGLVQQVEGGTETASGAKQKGIGLDPAILKRLSRGMRRPLNTVIGFSELIKSSAFGPIENPRYVDYARDIKFAGHDILRVIDELEEFFLLSDGHYELAPSEFELGTLLDKSLAQIRQQASEARVLLRSSISSHLPRIKADEASLRQALLNLLASAIQQTPQGGQVVVSAQREGDGTIAIHVRDSGEHSTDLAEKFVVFRDGTDPEGRALKPVQSSLGLALTRSLLAVNTCTLAVDPIAGKGTLLSLIIPRDLSVEGI